MSPIIVQIGPFAIRWYGVLVVSGVIAAALLSTVEARRRGDDPEHVWNALTLCLIFGIIGARLYHVFSSSSLTGIGWDYYRQHPIDIIAFWKGGFQGLGIFGAVLGGVAALAIYTWRAKLSFGRWLDIAAPGVLLAQAIGRWGNFFNHELYGKPTDLPWAIYIPPAYRLPGFEQFDRFHPTFLYESLWDLAMCLLLLWVARRFARWLKTGDVFILYLIAYPVGRAWVQYFRLDQWIAGTIPVEQVLPAAIAFLAIVALVVRHYVLPARQGSPATALATDAGTVAPAPETSEPAVGTERKGPDVSTAGEG